MPGHGVKSASPASGKPSRIGGCNPRTHAKQRASSARTSASESPAGILACALATLNHVANSIDYIRKIAGVDHVGIGSDFDGADDDFPVGLEDHSTYIALFAELIRRGWSDADPRKLAGENVLRALSQAETVAKRRKTERPPSHRIIRDLDTPPRP